MNAIIRGFCLLLWLAATPVIAGERLALVIGNAEYGTVSKLDNPGRDARLIAATLTNLGFEVTLLTDGTQIEMKRGIAQFGRSLRKAGTDATGLFYYAGHGVQSYGTNYLLPVDVAVADQADLDLVAVEAQSVLHQMFSAKNRTNIVILDACRNNPFSDIPDFNDNGLAEMQAPTGTFLAYATSPGGVALDGAENNSPFTTALATEMSTPGIPIEQVFKRVRVAVLEQTSGAQTPWDSSSLTSNFQFAEARQLTAAEIEEQQFWRSVQASADPVQLMLFLRGYPNSQYAGEARALLKVVMENELTGTSQPAPAPVAQGPSEAEQKMFEAAQLDGSAAGYDAYLQTFPNGVFAEFARQELIALREGSGTDPAAGPAPEAVAETPAAPEPVTPREQGPVTFASPLVSDLPEIDGRSISELIGSTPLFPPVEGLPESYWKTQTCSNCHEWTRDRICEQANVYLSENMQRSLEKPHPFGGALKQGLKSWAAGGCQ